MQIEVKGHSGCRIDIINDGNQLYIEKSTNDKKYIPRLLSQAEKQRKASNECYQHIRVPEIYDITKTENSVTVKMQYVYSKNFITYFEDAGFDQINYFIHALKIFLDSEIKASKIKAISKQVIIDKFNDVCGKIRNNNILNSDEEIIYIIRNSQRIFHSLENEILIPIGKCHGDLTFSNILFNGNNYYLIDFLDSFIESPLLDIVKIRQDSAYGWSQIMVVNSFDKVRMDLIYDKIDLEIDRYFLQFSWYEHYYKIFQLMNFLRILQYAKEKNVIDFLKPILVSLVK